MELVMNTVNMKRTPSVSVIAQQAESRVLDRVRMANARMKRQLLLAKNSATAAAEKSTVGTEQLAIVKDQLASARKTISDLEQKIKSLTSSLNDALAQNATLKSQPSKKERKSDSFFGLNKEKAASPTITVSPLTQDTLGSSSK